MNVLLTGASGFVGRHMAATARSIFGREVPIIATSRSSSEDPSIGPIHFLDVTDRDSTISQIRRWRPSHVVHLAGIAFLTSANADPAAAWDVHVEGTRNVAHAILEHAPDCVLISAGSGNVYGASARSGLPMDEKSPLAPIDEYAATKAAADLALGALANEGLRCIRMRPFNHTGPGQSDRFAIPGFAMQIARIEAGLQPPIIQVGDLDPQRDYLDVTDVARAYCMAIQQANDLAPGTILNVASGVARTMRGVLDTLLALTATKIQVSVDPARVRHNNLPYLIGNAELAKRVLGWQPQRRFEDTLAAVLDHCRSQIKANVRRLSD